MSSGRTYTIRLNQIREEYQVYVDEFYQGTIRKVGEQWVAHGFRNTPICGDDLAGLIDLIERINEATENE